VSGMSELERIEKIGGYYYCTVCGFYRANDKSLVTKHVREHRTSESIVKHERDIAKHGRDVRRHVKDISRHEESIERHERDVTILKASLGKINATVKTVGEKLGEVTAWVTVHKTEHKKLDEVMAWIAAHEVEHKELEEIYPKVPTKRKKRRVAVE